MSETARVVGAPEEVDTFLIWAEFDDRKVEDDERIRIRTSDDDFTMTYGGFKSHCTSGTG